MVKRPVGSGQGILIFAISSSQIVLVRKNMRLYGVLERTWLWIIWQNHCRSASFVYSEMLLWVLCKMLIQHRFELWMASMGLAKIWHSYDSTMANQEVCWAFMAELSRFMRRILMKKELVPFPTNAERSWKYLWWAELCLLQWQPSHWGCMVGHMSLYERLEHRVVQGAFWTGCVLQQKHSWQCNHVSF